MKLNNGSKIITEDDIILSDGEKSLSTVLSSHQQQISELKSNLKWIYKYGGVGGLGGSGGGLVQSYSVFASLNGIQLKDQSIVLNGTGLYPLYIKINNPNGASFNVRYSYITKSSTGNDIKQEQTVILSIENNYQLNTQINLNTNSNLQITVTDGNEEKQVGCSYITSPYEFTLSLVDDNGNEVLKEFFIETAKQKGVNVQLKYVISVPADIKYKYTFLDEEIENSITDKNNTILFPLDKSLFEQGNAGYYTVNMDFNIIPEGQELITLNKSLSFSLVPENLYMLLQPDNGIIYDKETENPYLFLPGYLTFNYKIYEGSANNRSYTVDIKLNGNSIFDNPLSVVERQQYSFKLFSISSGLNSLEISVSRTSTYTKTYYFYIQENTINLDWFENPTTWTSYYYRINEVTPNFSQFRDRPCIEQTVNSQVITINDTVPPTASTSSIINTHFAIGLQYNTINSENSEILSLYNATTETNIITIKQSEIIFNGGSRPLCIKKQSNADKDSIQDYHLIQLYCQYVKKNGNDNMYQLSVYIDGILEAAFRSLFNSALTADSILIQPVNSYINLLEIDYNEVNEDTHTNGDYDVYNYYLKYKNTILREDVGEEIVLLDSLKKFNIGLNGRVTTDESTINNLAGSISTPVLLMTYEDNGEFDSSGGFINSLEREYKEGFDLKFQVKVSWSGGNDSVNEIKFPSGFSNAIFQASLQGSSTMTYKSKNFDLEVVNDTETQDKDVYLYSPNFTEGDPKTFLPETKYTLKADVVDSSHSNNTTCGKFVNTVCNKFYNHIGDTSYYSNYIKNCLDGFPILLFLCHVTSDGENKNRTYYYQGVYNFNLGRSSYFNLGYKDLSVFGDNKNKILSNAGKSFTFCKITSSQNTLREGLGVAEIQGGNNYFDFSQWDETVLFQQSQEALYMFGDLVSATNLGEDNLKHCISAFVEKVAKSGGYLFETILKKNKGKYTDGYNAEASPGESNNQVPDYSTQYRKGVDNNGNITFIAKEGVVKGTALDLENLIIPNYEDNRQASLNYQATSEYYTICMVLGLVDSVMKNLNIKTWNAKTDYTATWFPALYDMDTCLGINNKGEDISYYAFSDYWSCPITKTEGNVQYPSSAVIYRDFSPHSLGAAGYDVPTNYLFTIAKYAKLVYPENDQEYSLTVSQYPQELYAKWRSATYNQDTNQGILKNADYFMDNFFSKNLTSICPALVSYNYRTKYFILDGDAYNDYNYIKFNGTRTNKVREWLEGRLHILDAYFNLDRSVLDSITYRDESISGDNKWQTLTINETPVITPTYNGQYGLENNSDIIILRDIFSTDTSKGIQLSGNIKFQIRCPEFSPLQITTPNEYYRYILGGDYNQQVEFSTVGSQVTTFGGSQAWTYLQNINWINTNNSLTISSDKLENITGNSGKFTSLSLNTPNVKVIELTSPNYSGQLNLSNSSNFPNLQRVDISKSKISLSASNLNITELNLSYMSAPNASVKVIDCFNLQTLSISNTTLQSLEITGLNDNLKDLTLNTSKIGTIKVSCSKPGGTFILSNDSLVTNVTVEGFKVVKITNCHKLNKLTINQSKIQNLEELQVINCQGSKLSITSEDTSENGKVSLSKSTIKKLSFRQSIGIVNAELPTNVELLPQAFYKCINLETVSGSNIYLSHEAFYNCVKYALKDKSGSFTNFKIKDTLTNLSYCFTGTLATWDFVKHFINHIVPEGNAISNVEGIFQDTEVTFGLEELQDSIANDSYPNFGKLNKVTNATYFFNTETKDGVNAIHKKFLEMGSPNGCKYNRAINGNKAVEHYYIPLNIFEDSISKIITFPFGQTYGYINKIIFTDENGNPLSSGSEIKLSEVFNPNGVPPSKLTSFSYFNPYDNYVFDWSNTFNAGWEQLSSLSNICNVECAYKGYDNLLKDVKKPVSIHRCWAKSTIPDVTADYYNMYNWDKEFTLSYLFSYDYTGTSASTNECNKYISADHFNELCDKILNSKTLTRIDCLFKNVTIIGNIEELKFGVSDKVNTKITRAAYTFKGLKYKTSENNDAVAIKLSKDFCKNLPSLQNVCGLFQKCWFSNFIPFNLFKKRKEQTQTVYVLDNDTYKQAKLYNYIYTQDMYNMAYLFKDCKFNEYQYTPDPNIEKNRVVDSEGNEYSTYYTRTLIPSSGEYIYTEHLVETQTEITDAENLVGGYISTFASYIPENPTLNGDPNKLIIPPDLFYGLVSSIISGSDSDYSWGVTEALACTSRLNGIIPENIFKNNRNVLCTNTFSNQIVIPRLVKTWENENITYNVYVHYPSKYTTNPNLSSAFTSSYIVLQNTKEGSKQTINYSLVLLEDSIPKVVSTLANAFTQPQLLWNAAGQSIPINSQHEFNFIGKIEGNSLTMGLDTSYFNLLNVDNVFNSRYIMVVNGNFFNIDVDAYSLRKSSVNSPVITGSWNYGITKNALARTAILPKASGNIQYLTNIVLDIKSDQIINSSESKQHYTNAGWTVTE